MNFIKLTKEKLDINSISELVTDERCGAISIFVGTTRDNFDDKPVSRVLLLLFLRVNLTFISDFHRFYH